MPHKAINRLGDLERAVMDAIWSAADAGHPSVSVREVHEALVARRHIAYTTVMTVMGRLADAGLLTQERSGRAYRYAAASSREALTAATMREQLEGMAGEDRRTALLHFLDDATADEIADLKVALARVEARHSGRGTPGRKGSGH
ncbi:transcriptional repressor BlaI [Phycicoccus ginsengisoli]